MKAGFHSNSTVLTSDGTQVSVKDLKVGDELLSNDVVNAIFLENIGKQNAEGGFYAYYSGNKVKSITKLEDDESIQVFTLASDEEDLISLEVTPTTKVFDADIKEFVYVKNIYAGDNILIYHNTITQIQELRSNIIDTDNDCFYSIELESFPQSFVNDGFIVAANNFNQLEFDSLVRLNNGASNLEDIE